MQSFPEGFRALVLGASGAIGAALVQRLRTEPRCASVVELGRRSVPAVDFDDEDSIGTAAMALQAKAPFHLIVNAAGTLHTPRFMPEKRLTQINYAQLIETFRVNTFGPAVVLARFAPLLDAQRGVLAMVSAKVGSIEDNRMGGWYSYRASKAALNMLVKCAAIELQRSNPGAVLAALHPGTVRSNLSAPFRGAEIGRSPLDAATDMLRVLDGLTPADTGGFFAYTGDRLPW